MPKLLNFDSVVVKKKETHRLLFDDVPPKHAPEPPSNTKHKLLDFDALPEKTPLYKSHEQKGPLTFKDMLPEERIEKFGKIEEWTTIDRAIDRTKRFLNVGANTVMGDIPFARNLLPKNIRESTPQTTSEKIAAPILGLGRDIYGYGKISKVVKPFADVQRVTKTGKFIAKTVAEGVKTGVLGAATAGSEDPVDIAKKAGVYGVIGAGSVPAVEAISWAGTKVVNALGKSQNLNAIGEWLGLKLRENKANDLVRKRHGEIDSRLIDSEKYITDLEKQITLEENKALAFIVETGGKSNAPISKGAETAAKSIRQYLDDAHAELVRDYGKDVGFIENYIPHMWDVPKNKEKMVVNWFMTRNPHLQQRRIETIQEGIEKFGLKPKYEKVTDILRTYDQVRIKTAGNFKFVQDLKSLEENGVKLVQRADKAPQDWPVIDHPAARRAMGKIIGEGDDAKLILSKQPVRVHPDIYPDVKAVLETHQPGKAARVLDTINTSIKQSVLTLSLFHHMALSETAIAAGMGKEALKVWNPVKVYKAFKSGNHKAFLNDVPLAKEGVKDGLTIGAISDVEGGRTIVNSLRAAEKAIGDNAIALGVRAAVRKPLELNNKFLWDYLHTTYKLSAYQKIKADMLKRFPDKSVEAVGKEAAQFVNDTFGGQPWEIMAKSKQWQQFSRFALLSPDWVLSTMKQALSPFGVGAASKAGVEIRKEMGKDFWQKALVYFGGSMNILNYAYSKAHTGQGKYMWDNSPGKKTYLFIGYNDDGTERYLRWGKQFRELAEAINNPAEVAGRKISPLIRVTKNQLYPDALWQREIAENPFWSKVGLTGRATALAKDVTPYSITQQQRVGSFNPLSFVGPISRGMTPYRARKLFRTSIIRKNKKLFQETYKASLNNEIDPDPIFKQANASLKAEKTFEATLEARKISVRYKKLGPIEGEIYLKKLKGSGELTPLIAKRLAEIMNKKSKAQKKKAEFEELTRGEAK